MIANSKNLIHMNAIWNNPVTIEDIDIAEKIFGRFYIERQVNKTQEPTDDE